MSKPPGAAVFPSGSMTMTDVSSRPALPASQAWPRLTSDGTCRPEEAGCLCPVRWAPVPNTMLSCCRDVPNGPAGPVGFCPKAAIDTLQGSPSHLGIRHAGRHPWNEHEPMPCRSPCYLPPWHSRLGHPSCLPPRTRSANRPIVTSTDTTGPAALLPQAAGFSFKEDRLLPLGAIWTLTAQKGVFRVSL